MKNMTLEHIAAVCGGTYIGNEADKKREIKGAVIDSRRKIRKSGRSIHSRGKHLRCDEEDRSRLPQRSGY